MSDQSTVVIIEDESAIAENLIHVLEVDGYHAAWFATAGEGLAFLQQTQQRYLCWMLVYRMAMVLNCAKPSVSFLIFRLSFSQQEAMKLTV